MSVSQEKSSTVPNTQVEDYLRFHLSLPVSPGFAVMITGDNGSGKTWFISQFFKTYAERPMKVLYVSLFGIESLSILDEQIHHLAQKALRTVQTSNSRAIDTITELLHDDPARVYVLILDDLEKSSLDTDALLGHINTFLSVEGLRCVLIANTSKLGEPIRKGLTERIVGKHLQVHSDLSEVFDVFTKKISTESARHLINAHKRSITSSFQKAGYGDLRHLYQTLCDLEFFLSGLPSRFLANRALMEEVISLFCIFSFELRHGTIKAEDLRQIGYLAMDRAYLEANEYGQDATNHPMLKVAEKYALLDETSLSPALWCELFTKGHIERSRLIDALENSRYLIGDTSPAWQRLWHYQELDEDEFEVILSMVREQWERYEFTAFGEILHICGMFLHFSVLGLHTVLQHQVIEDCKAYIDTKRKEKLWGHAEKEFFEYDLGSGWERLDYLQGESAAFKEIREYLREQLELSLTETLTKDAQQLIRVIIAHPEDFYRRSNATGGEMKVSYDKPLFSTMDVEMFFNVFMALSNKTKQQIADVLKHRYEAPHHAATLVSELPFLEAFARRLSHESIVRQGRLDGHILALIKERSIDHAIELLKAAKESA